jgi:transaldolase
VDEGVTGVTSNPSIFQKSICETHDYDDIVESLEKSIKKLISQRCMKMAIEDIQRACDVYALFTILPMAWMASLVSEVSTPGLLYVCNR